MQLSKSTYKNEILVAGQDYPRTYREFVTMFHDDQSCREFLYKLRWPDGFVCTRCEVLSTPWEQTHHKEWGGVPILIYSDIVNSKTTKIRVLSHLYTVPKTQQ